MNRRRVLQTIVLFAGLLGLAVAIARTVDDAQDQVWPSPAALAASAALALLTIVSSGRAWTSLFEDVLERRVDLARLRGTYYLSQLTKYLPAGGVVQAASQLSMATAAGVPLGRVAVAFPVSAVTAIAAGATLGIGLAFDISLPTWARTLGVAGVIAPALLHRGLMATVLRLARRVIHRIPSPDRLPSQRAILTSYGWAIAGIGSLSAGYAVLLGSSTHETNAATVFSAYALSWVIGFLAVPIPAGVGVREGLLIAFIPGADTAALLAASLALRLLSIATEVVAILGNRVAVRRHTVSREPPPPAEELMAP